MLFLKYVTSTSLCAFPPVPLQPHCHCHCVDNLLFFNPTTCLKHAWIRSYFHTGQCKSSIKTLQCTQSVALEFPYKMTFSPSPPPTVPSKEEECPSSDACSIVHALPPICSPHSAASAETLRRLKGQIAHTKRERKRERQRWGSARKR